MCILYGNKSMRCRTVSQVYVNEKPDVYMCCTVWIKVPSEDIITCEMNSVILISFV